jgi:hypothetical protein
MNGTEDGNDSNSSSLKSQWSRWSRPAAIFLTTLALVVVLLALGRAWLHDAQRHVTIEAEVTDDIEQVFVNCQFVEAITAGDSGYQSLDLGWLDPDDRISLAVVNSSGSYADVYFRGVSNEDQIFVYKHRSLAVRGNSEKNRKRYVFERTHTADGDLIGGAGCQRSRFVALPEYMRLADDANPSQGTHRGQRLQPVGFSADRTFDLLDRAGGAGPWVLVALGFALMIPLAARELVLVSEWNWKDGIPLGVAVIGALLALLGLASPRFVVVVVGLILYLIAILVLWSGPRDGSARSAGGSAGSGSR